MPLSLEQIQNIPASIGKQWVRYNNSNLTLREFLEAPESYPDFVRQAFAEKLNLPSDASLERIGIVALYGEYGWDREEEYQRQQQEREDEREDDGEEEGEEEGEDDDEERIQKEVDDALSLWLYARYVFPSFSSGKQNSELLESYRSSPEELQVIIDIMKKDNEAPARVDNLERQILNGNLTFEFEEKLEPIQMVPYIDIAGNLHPPIGTPHWNNVRELYGQGALILDRQPGDPYLPELKINEEIGSVGDNARKGEPLPAGICLGQYEIDPVTQIEISELYSEEPNAIYFSPLRNSNRCYYIPSIVETWERALASFDTTSKRVITVYPSDGVVLVTPAQIRDILNFAEQIGVDLKLYPAITFLAREGGLLEDIYKFILQYDYITREFERQRDAGAANRRDLLAISELKRLGAKYGIPKELVGFRKYSDIPSSQGPNGTQVFYSCLLTQLLVARGFELVADDQVVDAGAPSNLKWLRTNQPCISFYINNRESKLCRPCIKEPIVVAKP